MATRTGRILFACILIPALYAANLSSAEAAVVTTRRAVINSGQSTVTLQPSPFVLVVGSEPSEPVTVTMGISGTFDIVIHEYAWEQEPLGGNGSPFQPPPVRETWLDFDNVHFALDQPGYYFEFPTFMVRMSDIYFGGSDGPCDFPSPPNSSCMGFYTGVLAHVEGTLDGRSLHIEGTTSHGISDDYFSYSITATVVPLPAPVLLLGSALLFGLLPAASRRYRQRETTCSISRTPARWFPSRSSSYS